MDPLPPIPTPTAQKWREFRINILPIIVFLVLVVAAALLWKNYVQPVGVVGEVESVKADIVSLQEGMLTELLVDRFQRVTNHQVIGHVLGSDPDLVRASLASLESELRVTGMRMAIDERRREQDFQGLRLSLMKEQVTLAADRANLIQASNSYVRALQIDKDDKDVFSADEIDWYRAAFETLEAQIQERTKLVEALSKEIKQMEAAGPTLPPNPVAEAITAQLKALELSMQPTVLRAPIDGVVSLIWRWPGERVVRGEPIVTILAPEASRIVGYIRQPVTIHPRTNDTVLIRTRSRPVRVGSGQILRVGASMQDIRPGLVSQDTMRLETGLPILVSLPPGLNVVPGEFVDLAIRPSAP